MVRVLARYARGPGFKFRSGRVLFSSPVTWKSVLLVDFTTPTLQFYKEMNPKPDLHSVEKFNLKLQGAGSNTIPYSGCILCHIRAPFTGQDDVIEVGALIVPTTEYNLVPVIVYTNAIDAFQNLCQ